MEIRPGWGTKIVSGRKALQGLKPMLLELAKRYGQDGAMDYLEFFLDQTHVGRRTPHVVLIGDGLEAGISAERVYGALWVYAYRLPGMRIFASDDISGRRALLSPDEARVAYARFAAEALVKMGADAVVLSFMDFVPGKGPNSSRDPWSEPGAWLAGTRRKLVRSHLPLEPTMDATLAKIGQRTRSNMRYYRRRAEAQLGCVFHAEAEMTEEEFLECNRQSTFAVSDAQATWRYASVKRYPGAFLMGIRAGDGRWLSVTGGRRYADASEIDWQMNRADLPKASLCTVMRSYLIEHEIGLGMKRLFIEGGTPQAIRVSFTIHPVRDMVFVRNTRRLRVLERMKETAIRYANRFSPRLVPALKILTDRPGLQWERWR